MTTIGKIVFAMAALSFLAACVAKMPGRPLDATSRVEVIRCRLAANDEYVGVRFRMRDAGNFDPGSTELYLVDEATGERFDIVHLQRIGRVAEFSNPDEKGVHDVMFRNPDGRLKPGARVTLVIGPARREHVVLEK